MTKTHQLLAFVVALIWGTNFIVIKYGLEELPPFLFVTLRFSFVVFPLILFLPKPKTSWLLMCAYGVFIGLGQFGLLFYAMERDISPGLASLVIQMQVFFSIILAILFFKEQVKIAQWIALVIALAGIVLIATHIEGQTTILGLLLVLLAGMNWAMSNMIVKKAGTVDIIAFLVYASLFAVPVLALMSFYFEGWQLIKTSLETATLTSVYVVLWQTIGNTLIGYGIWNYLLSRYSAATVTPWSLLVPVSGMIGSYIILDEAMPAWKILAVFLVLIGLGINIYVAQRELG